MDRLTDFGAGFDWITPAIAMARSALGSHVYYVVPRERLGDVVTSLRGAGIRLSDQIVSGNKFHFGVHLRNSRQAETILRHIL